MQSSMGESPNPLYQPGPPPATEANQAPPSNKLDLNQLLAVDSEAEGSGIKELPSSSEQGLSQMPSLMNDPLLRSDAQPTQPTSPDLPPPSMTSDYKSAINTIRENVKTLERHGTKIETEEFDFDSIYQIIIKLDKN